MGPNELIFLLTPLAAASLALAVTVAWKWQAAPVWRWTIAALPFVVASLVEAYDVTAYYVVQATMMTLGYTLLDWRSRRRQAIAAPSCRRAWPRSFSLRFFLMLTAGAALLVWLSVKLGPRPYFVWLNLLLNATTFALAACLAMWAMLSRFRRVSRAMLVLLVVALLSVPVAVLDRFLLDFPDSVAGTSHSNGLGISLANGVFDVFFWPLIPLVCSYTLYLIVWLVLAERVGWLQLAWEESPAETSRDHGARASTILSNTRGGRYVVAVVTLTSICTVPCLLACAAVVPTGHLEMVPLAEAEAYDRLTVACQQLTLTALVNDPDTADRDELTGYLRRNEKALHQIRVAMVPPTRKQLRGNWAQDGKRSDLDAWRSAARALQAEGVIHQRSGRIDDAARSYLDLVRLSERIERGGLAIDWLVARTIEGIGIYRLGAICRQLSPECAQEVADMLWRRDRSREPADEVWQRDRVWTEVVQGWCYRLYHRLERLTDQRRSIPLSTPEKASVAMSRLVLLESALVTYQAEHGEWPDSLDDLGVKYADQQFDPFSDHGRDRFIYRRDGDAYRLYSLGEDQDDDQGAVPASHWADDGDLCVEFFEQQDLAR